jgi:RHS repeat-associated protein
MFYPNAYINFNGNGEYTKHYYSGSERIASRLGNANTDITVTANARLTSRSTQLDSRFQDDIRELMSDNSTVCPPSGISVNSLHQTGTSDIYYYHTNHLGSTAFVTDQNQNITQGFLYAPFGEITTEFNATFGSDIIPKYSFNAKELDEETGMYYYEARYYKPPVFTSRDAMFEKYFWMTPYAYCANNPVKYVDPSGEAWKPTFNEETGEYTGYQWIDPKYSYNSDGTLKDGLYEQAIFFSENGTYNPESKYNIGSSTATVYKSDGTTETFDACTHPSDASKYATIPAGIYTARRGIHNGRSSSYPAIRILGKIKLGGPNPRYPENDFAEKINIHKPGNNNFTGIGNNGPVSEGCLLIDINAWDRFLRCFSENTDISVTVSRTMSAPTNKNVRIFPFPIVTPICPIDKTRVDVPIRF